MDKLLKMTLSELMMVKGVTVSNEFGSVEFLDTTDVSRVDFADAITISKRNLEVYDDARIGSNKPPVGQKLNKPAIITLNNIELKPGQTEANKV